MDWGSGDLDDFLVEDDEEYEEYGEDEGEFSGSNPESKKRDPFNVFEA
jgi:hypothetical protein